MTYAPQGDENICTVYEPGHFWTAFTPSGDNEIKKESDAC